MKFILFLAVTFMPSALWAGETAPLTLDHVLKTAKSSAPAIKLSLAELEEARARVTSSEIRTTNNPELEIAAGGGNDGEKAEITLVVPFEQNDKKTSRIAFAKADLAQAELKLAESRRHAAATAARAFYTLLYTKDRLLFFQKQKALADEGLKLAKERLTAGDAARFDMNLATAETIKAESQISSAMAALAQAEAEMAKTLGMPSVPDIDGNLADRTLFDLARDLPPASERTALLSSMIDMEVAGISLAETKRMSDMAFIASYQREGDDNAGIAGIRFSLPFLNPDPGSLMEARARHQKAKAALDNFRIEISTTIEGLKAAYDANVTAANKIGKEGLSIADENEAMAHESYKAGKIGLAILLSVRRETMGMRLLYMDRLLDAALAGTELASVSGIFSIGKD